MSQTATTVESNAYTAVHHLQQVTKKISKTIQVLIMKGYGTCECDLEKAMTDINIFILNACIRSIKAQLYNPTSKELIREYRFDLSDTPLTERGSDAESPPLPSRIIPGTQLRITVIPTDYSEETCAWFTRLGWQHVERLTESGKITSQEYGTFASGGFGVTRIVRIAEKYDVSAKS